MIAAQISHTERHLLCMTFMVLALLRMLMHQERVSIDVHIFTSDLYAQVTAGLIVTRKGCVLIDTLPFPVETAGILRFASRHCSGVQQIIYSHYHADHTYGACMFPNSEVVAHAKTRQLLIERAIPTLDEDKTQSPELADVEIVLPSVVFSEGEMVLHLGGKTVRLLHVPGHTEDSIAVYVQEEKILFAADTVMPAPSIVDGDLEQMIHSLQRLQGLAVENLVQGHGEVILRGEVPIAIDRSVAYLETIRERVNRFIAQGKPRNKLDQISIEDCGLSRIPLNGLVQQIHAANLAALYDRLTAA